MPTKVGVGVNECVLLETCQGSDYLVQSTGLAGCVLAIVTLDAKYCFVAHVADYNGFPGECEEQEKSIFEFCEQLPSGKPTRVAVVGKGFMGNPSHNMKRTAGVLKKAFPSSPPPEFIFGTGAQVALNESTSWKIKTESVDYSGGINTKDVKDRHLHVTHGVLMSDKDKVCTAESNTN